MDISALESETASSTLTTTVALVIAAVFLVAVLYYVFSTRHRKFASIFITAAFGAFVLGSTATLYLDYRADEKSDAARDRNIETIVKWASTDGFTMDKSTASIIADSAPDGPALTTTLRSDDATRVEVFDWNDGRLSRTRLATD